MRAGGRRTNTSPGEGYFVEREQGAPGNALIDTLSQAPQILAGLIRSIPAVRLAARRKPHFWTIAEHVGHLAAAQPMLMRRLERFRDEESPNFTPYRPSQDEPPLKGSTELPAVETALDQFASWRKKQIALIESLPAEVWERQGTHPEYERYSPMILVRHMAMHDHWHMYRIEELWITKDEFLTEVQ